MRTAPLAIAALLLAAPIAAEDAAPKNWKDSAELSYVKTTGNTDTSTLAAKNLFNYDWAKAALEVTAGGLGTESRGLVTAEQYGASEKVSLKFPGSNYAFQKTAWNKDRFSGIMARYDFALGVGHKILDTPADKLFTEGGAGYIFEDRLGSENQSFGTYRAYGKYIRTLSPTANVSQDLEYLGNLKDSSGYRVTGETALVTTINSHFSLKAGYAWKFVNSPAEGFGKTDSTTSMAIILNY